MGIRRAGVTLVSVLVLGTACLTHASVIDSSLNFATVNQNLWGPGTATIVDESITLPPPDGFSGSVSLPNLEDPTSAIADFIGIDVGAHLSPTVTFDTGLTASFHANTGSIDLNYPTQVSLSLPDSVQAGQSFTVSAALPGPPQLSQFAALPVSALVGAAGTGYENPNLNRFLTSVVGGALLQPTAGFTTVFPYAEARVNLDLTATGSVASEVCLVFCIDGPTLDLGSVNLNQQLFELSTLDGLRVLDQSVVPFNQTVPVAEGVSIAFDSPNISLDGALRTNGTLSDSQAQDFLDFSFNVNQLIPLIGQILQSNIGPVGYDLLSVTPTISLGIQQQITFQPTPMVALQFDAPVVDNRTGQLTNLVQFAVGDSVSLTPTVGGGLLSSSSLSVKPTFFMDNTIHNTTRLVLGGTLEVAALAIDTPQLGPVIDPVFDLGTIPLLDLDNQSWTLSIPPITGQAQTVARTGFGLQLQQLNYLVAPVGGDTNAQGHSRYDLYAGQNLVAEVFGQTVTTGGFGCGSTEIPSPTCQSFFVSDSDVFGANQEALGRYFCITCNDLSSLFLDTSPFLTDPTSGDQLFLSDLTSVAALASLADLTNPQSGQYDAQLAQSQYYQDVATTTPHVVPAPTAVSEPESLSLLCGGMLMLLLQRRRRSV
jgi:hypothetical protein